MAKTDRLKEIIQKKREKIIIAQQQVSIDELKEKIQSLPATRPFMEAIHKPRTISLIAEIKKASPSRGIIRQDFNVPAIARDYKDAGVQAVSVLTEEDYFQGAITYLQETRDIIDVPILRKDFILEAYQVYESRAYGADAILLISDLLTREKIIEFMGIAESLGLDCLVEVHDEKELKKVINLKVPLIGVNNRNLHTLAVDAKTTESLFPLIPKDKIVVVESGIKSYQDVLFLKILGVSAVLIGTAFMEAQGIKQKVEEIMGW